MKRLAAISQLSLALLLAGCLGGQVTNEPAAQPPQQSSSGGDRPQVTKNVTYRGVVEEAGISIYMEGSHRLALPDGRVLLLQSESLELDDYVGEDVLATGDIRPTVEAGGIIMEVKEIESMEESSSSSAQAVSSAPSSLAVSSAAASVAASAGTSVAASSVAAEPVSGEIAARAAVMARDDTAQGNWTQQYCSSHIGFCIPVHRNWWFKSFGTTTSSLWHVEIAPAEIETIGEGPLVLNLVSGSLESIGASDREVRAVGDRVIGYRAWTDNRHFEISAPSNLQAAVKYITDNLAVYEATE
ncbi:hypothetical protein HYZ99_05730 [Candidatus Peregrinibacteria bacterium]|nr:hypothetical protein [Candidatus Peregrinibacteria bacterium]